MFTSDANGAQGPKDKNRGPRAATSGDKDGNARASEDHLPKEFTERDLFIRIAFEHAGYDVSKFKDGAELDDDAKELLKAKTTCRRVVWRSWPRDPKGKFIAPDDMPPGKTTSNGVELWGATLRDFYRVRRIPQVPSLQTLTTGSKMAAWMKKHGEEKYSDEMAYAADAMVWAEMEDDPKEVPPCDIADLIEPMEMNIAWEACGKFMLPKAAEAMDNEGEENPEGRRAKRERKRNGGKERGGKEEKAVSI